MKTLIISISIILQVSIAFSQSGKLLLIGGGTERSQTTAWNYLPYKWAVENSTNQRVAIIAFADDDNWLVDYFTTVCNAQYAKHFTINTLELADNQVIYDSLITYGMIFLKGGDQYNYYSTYKNTKTQAAIEFVYNSGGVIAGTSAGCAILSGITYTAAVGSVIALTTLQNVIAPEITLENDFLQFVPNTVFDTHFAERGRFGRLISFMANRKYLNNETITGIGVDDLTAFAIDENFIGTAFGTGAINIYKTVSNQAFTFNGSKALVDSLEVIQLLHGCSYDFNNETVTGFESETNILNDETGNYTVFASGSDNINYNIELLADFINTDSKKSGDKILIVTGDFSTAETFKLNMQSLGATQVDIIMANAQNANNQEIEIMITASQKVLFLKNNYDDLFSFISGSSGQVLQNKITRSNAITAFVGDNSRFAGRIVVENYLEAGAGYYGDLEFKNGLGLLNSTVVMPNSYLFSDMYENAAVAVPYSMVQNELKFGIWLTRFNYLKYFPDNNKTWFTGKGSIPVMIIENQGFGHGISNQTSTGTGSQNPRMIAGFEKMYLHLIDETKTIQAGNEIDISANDNFIVPELIDIKISKNNQYLEIECVTDAGELQIIDTFGRIIFDEQLNKNCTSIDISSLNTGIYIVVFISESKNIKKIQKIFIP